MGVQRGNAVARKEKVKILDGDHEILVGVLDLHLEPAPGAVRGFQMIADLDDLA